MFPLDIRSVSKPTANVQCSILWENFQKFPPNTKFPENLQA